MRKWCAHVYKYWFHLLLAAGLSDAIAEHSVLGNNTQEDMILKDTKGSIRPWLTRMYGSTIDTATRLKRSVGMEGESFAAVDLVRYARTVFAFVAGGDPYRRSWITHRFVSQVLVRNGATGSGSHQTLPCKGGALEVALSFRIRTFTEAESINGTHRTEAKDAIDTGKRPLISVFLVVGSLILFLNITMTASLPFENQRTVLWSALLGVVVLLCGVLFIKSDRFYSWLNIKLQKVGAWFDISSSQVLLLGISPFFAALAINAAGFWIKMRSPYAGTPG
jgi:hypothetical protein